MPNETEEEEEDFIPLGEADNFVGFDNASDDSLDPSAITLATFHRLLDRYPATARAEYRQKMVRKVLPQPTKGEKKRALRDAATTTSVFKEPSEVDLDSSQVKYVEAETARFEELDRWRFVGFPRVLRERRDAGERFVDKEELVMVMDWKTKNGHPRPTLMGMIKGNKANTVRSTTASAFKTLSATADPVTEPGEAFPKTSLEAVSSPLRGVGPATASLVLSIATSDCDPDREVPFYSDHTYLWLCLEAYPHAEENERRAKRLAKFTKPNGELNVKYNMHEYRELWDAVWALRTRLNRFSKSECAKEKGFGMVSCTDVEKVAFVIRHIRVSGFEIELPEEEEKEVPFPKPKEQDADMEKKAKAKAKSKAKARARSQASKKEKKRKREEEAETGQKRKRV